LRNPNTGIVRSRTGSRTGECSFRSRVDLRWTNFAKTGDPNGAGLPSWPAATPASRQTLVIDDDTNAVADFRRHQVGVMEIGWAMRTGLTAP
jgi:carboxylesterase type B